MITKIFTPGIVFILTLLFGFWLSKLGRPYHGMLFNIHKLLALGVVVLTGIQLIKMLKGANSLALLVTLLIVAAACVIALFASGALMSLGKLDYALVLAVHRIAPVVLVIVMALAAYLLERKI